MQVASTEDCVMEKNNIEDLLLFLPDSLPLTNFEEEMLGDEDDEESASIEDDEEINVAGTGTGNGNGQNNQDIPAVSNVQKSVTNLLNQLSPSGKHKSIVPAPTENGSQKKFTRHVHGYGSFAPSVAPVPTNGKPVASVKSSTKSVETTKTPPAAQLGTVLAVAVADGKIHP